MYSVLICFLVLLPTYFTNMGGVESAGRTYMIRSASMLFSNTACLMILFAPKVYHVLRKTPDSDQTEKTEAASKTQKSTKAKITQPTGKNGTLVVKSGHTGAISGQGVGNGVWIRTGGQSAYVADTQGID